MSSSSFVTRPAPSEHSPYAAGYIDAAARAIADRGHADLIALLEAQQQAWHAMLGPLAPSVAGHRYAPDKWTLAESLLHVADTERVFAYRLLRIARGDTTPLPGFDQDAWVPASGAGARSLTDLLAELDAVRLATLTLIRSLDAEALSRLGMASGNPVSARALAWMIAGHVAHHLQLTRERYLAG